MTEDGNIKGGIPEEHPSEPSRPSLPQICNTAADHLAGARIALGGDAPDSDMALAHLDEAIACLKRLWQLGTARKSAPEGHYEAVRRSA